MKNQLFSRAALILITAATLLPNAASASIVITSATDFSPESTIIVPWATSSAVGARQDRQYFQTFELESALPVASLEITVDLAAEGADFTLRLFDTGADLNGTEGSLNISGWTELVSETYTVTAGDAAVSTSPALLTWDLEALFTPTVGRTYALMIDDLNAGSNVIRWRRDGSNQNSDPGIAAYVFDSGSTWDQLIGGNRSTVDLTLAATVIPEPSTVILMSVSLIAVLGLIARRRRNR